MSLKITTDHIDNTFTQLYIPIKHRLGLCATDFSQEQWLQYSWSTHIYILWSYRIYIGNWLTRFCDYKIKYISGDAIFCWFITVCTNVIYFPMMTAINNSISKVDIVIDMREAVVCCRNSLQRRQEYPHCTQSISWLLMTRWREMIDPSSRSLVTWATLWSQ